VAHLARIGVGRERRGVGGGFSCLTPVPPEGALPASGQLPGAGWGGLAAVAGRRACPGPSPAAPHPHDGEIARWSWWEPGPGHPVDRTIDRDASEGCWTFDADRTDASPAEFAARGACPPEQGRRVLHRYHRFGNRVEFPRLRAAGPRRHAAHGSVRQPEGHSGTVDVVVDDPNYPVALRWHRGTQSGRSRAFGAECRIVRRRPRTRSMS
jgi:hypothetical protein